MMTVPALTDTAIEKNSLIVSFNNDGYSYTVILNYLYLPPSPLQFSSILNISSSSFYVCFDR